jgi:transposase
MNVDTMLKDPQTQRYEQRRTHRTYTPQFKAELMAMCQKPGASIAAVVLQHGMNANLLHRWRKEWAQGLRRLEGGVTTAVATPQTPAFIPIELSAAASTTASEQPSVASSTLAADIAWIGFKRLHRDTPTQRRRQCECHATFQCCDLHFLLPAR